MSSAVTTIECGSSSRATTRSFSRKSSATSENPYAATLGLRIEPAKPGAGLSFRADVDVKLVWKEVSEKKNETKDKFIDSLDYNFDKYSDLRLTKAWPYKVGQKYYLVWLFEEEKNKYVLSAEISKLQGPVPNPKTRRIESTDVGGYAGFEYVKRMYSINPKGKLKVQTRVTQTMSDRSRLTFRREVRVRIAGELQRVCKIAVPAEGKPNRLWGKKYLCSQFLTKD